MNLRHASISRARRVRDREQHYDFSWPDQPGVGVVGTRPLPLVSQRREAQIELVDRAELVPAPLGVRVKVWVRELVAT